jgi:tetratricopeptide (TPR) repeat protein
MTIRSAVLATLLVTSPVYAADFYTALMDRGLAHFNAGDYGRAAKELRIAAFGFLDSIDQYETAYTYAAIAFHRLGREADARAAAARVAEAEHVQARFAALDLPPAIRSEFQRMASVARQAPPPPVVTTQTQPAKPVERQTPPPVVAKQQPQPVERQAPPPVVEKQPPQPRPERRERPAPASDRASSLRAAYDLYAAGRYADAVQAFAPLRPQGKAEAEQQFAYAVVLYETGRYADAKRELAAALPNLEPSDDVMRYRARIEGAIVP